MHTQATHKIEMLEAELRLYRQSLRTLAEAVLAGKDQAYLEALAKQAKSEILEEV